MRSSGEREPLHQKTEIIHIVSSLCCGFGGGSSSFFFCASACSCSTTTCRCSWQGKFLKTLKNDNAGDTSEWIIIQAINNRQLSLILSTCCFSVPVALQDDDDDSTMPCMCLSSSSSSFSTHEVLEPSLLTSMLKK